MTGREQGAPKPIRHPLGTVTSAEGTRLSSSNRPDQAAKYGREQSVQVEAQQRGPSLQTGWTPFERMSRRQAIDTCYALEDMRDRAIKRAEAAEAEVARLTTERSPS
jgi:hypothetical protein